MADCQASSNLASLRSKQIDAFSIAAKVRAVKERTGVLSQTFDVAKWFQGRIFVPGFTPDMWGSEHTKLAQLFISDYRHNRIVAYMHEDGFVLQLHDIPCAHIQSVNQIQYFIKLEPRSDIDSENIEFSLMYGCVNGKDTRTLLNLMNNLFLPHYLSEKSWSTAVRRDFCVSLHKFMASLTETCYHSQGNTVLYVPEYPDVDLAPTNATEFLQRMEALIIFWTRQLKEVISNQNTSYNIEADVPLDEINFWRRRNDDLGRLRSQLMRSEVRAVVDYLISERSHFVAEFLNQEQLLATTHNEARGCLRYLSVLVEPCERLSRCHPTEMPAVMPLLLNTVRLIWQTSPYYNTPEQITALLRKICAQITTDCAKYITIADVLEGDSIAVIEKLEACIRCGQEWQTCYLKTVLAIARDPSCPNWDWDPEQMGIFAQLDALTQRCGNLIEVCEGILQFARPAPQISLCRKSGISAIGGQRNLDIEKSLRGLRNSFLRHVSKLRCLPYDPLNVKVTEWHADFAGLKSVLRELELMLSNTIATLWDKSLSLRMAVDLMEALDTLAVRPSIRAKVDEKRAAVFALYDAEMRTIKTIFAQQKRDRVPGVFAEYAVQAEMLLLRASTAYALIERILTCAPEYLASEAAAVYSSVAEALVSYMRSLHGEWVSSVIDSAAADTAALSTLSQRLAVPLFTRANPDRNDRVLLEKARQQTDPYLRARTVAMIPLDVGLDPLIMRVIEETSVWNSLNGDFPIPYPAIEASGKEADLRHLRSRAVEVAHTYNNLVTVIGLQERCDAGEKGLLDEYLLQAHRLVLPGLVKLKWDDDVDVQDWFLSHTSHRLFVLFARMLAYKLYQSRCYNAARALATLDLIAIDAKIVHSVESFEARQVLQQARIIRVMRGLRRVIASHMIHLKSYLSGHGPHIQRLWMDYVANLDACVTDALRLSVKHSLGTFLHALYGEQGVDETNKHVVTSPMDLQHPLFDMELWLDNDELRVDVSPTLVTVANTISKTTRTATSTIQTIPRFMELCTADRALPVATHVRAPRSHYSLVLTEDADILTSLQQIINAPSIVAADLGKLLSEIDQRYSAIWSVDKALFMRRYMHSRRTVKSFEMDIQHYRNFAKDVAAEDSVRFVRFVRVHCEQLKTALSAHCVQWQHALTQLLHDTTMAEMTAVHKVCLHSMEALNTQPDSLDALAEAVTVLTGLQAQFPTIKDRYEPLREALETLDKFDVHVSDEEKALLQTVWRSIQSLQGMLVHTDRDLTQRKADVKAELQESMTAFAQHVLDQRTELKENGPYSAPAAPTDSDVAAATQILQDLTEKLHDSRAKASAMHKGMDVFGIPHPEYKELDAIEQELQMLEAVWSLVQAWLGKWHVWSTSQLSLLDAAAIEADVAKFQGKLSKLPRQVKSWQVWRSIWAVAQQFKQSLPLIGYLCSPAMRERHWAMLQAEIRSDTRLHADMLTMATVYQLGIQHHMDTVTHIAGVAGRELVMETQLTDIAQTWQHERLDLVRYKTRFHKVRSIEQLADKLEAHQLILTTQKNSIFFPNFAADITSWLQTLADIMETVELLVQVQTKWVYLDNVIAESSDIGKQLPKEKELFSVVSAAWAEVMDRVAASGRAIDLVGSLRAEGLMDRLARMQESLDKINQKLDAFLETKRTVYPRFYFLANDDLLEMLGQGRDPSVAQKHISKIFMGIKTLQVQQSNNSSRCLEVHGVVAPDGEALTLCAPVLLDGEVEHWLREVDKASGVALQKELFKALGIVQKQNHRTGLALASWLKSSPAQILLLSAQLGWTMRTQLALQESVKSKRSIRKMFADWQDYIVTLTRMVRGDLDKDVRAKVNALTVIEVHHRDVLARLRVLPQHKNPLQAFDWTSQLRFYYESKVGEMGKCFVKQHTATFSYAYEYQGNSGRLVVTPLTDRAYLTMTNALALVLGCNPQGPAGTGKTETVKDLGKNLGRFVLVFNCTPLMDTGTMARNLSGLAQTGFWGCFDEFNRIQVDVLAVVAQQLATVFDALRSQKTHFNFQGRTLPLDSRVGVFVTMNPSSDSYAGRAELPENLKTLLRPIAMMVPDAQLIAEILLLSEGFTDAATLARKALLVYRFMDVQLSKQSHYSYGLRALKAVLARAGVLARSEPNIDDELVQEQVLYRALGDMNRAALVPQDLLIFDAILADIFLDTHCPASAHRALRTELTHQLRLAGLQATGVMVEKVLQLYESLCVRHGNMLVGESLAGKSTAWRILARAITALHARRTDSSGTWRVVDTLPLNPKAVTADELFGYYTQAGEWQDGVLAAQVRKACAGARDLTQERWVVLDGPVDTLWIESMNTLLDDNKILTLVNQDRIPIPSNVRILFEVADLHAASPATVSRCGMVYFCPQRLGWKPYMVSWLRSKRAEWDTAQADDTPIAVVPLRRGGKTGPADVAACARKGVLTREAVEAVIRLVDRFMAPILHCFHDKTDARLLSRFAGSHGGEGVGVGAILQEPIPTSALFKARNVTRIFDSILNSANGVDHTQDTGAGYVRLVELWFMFACIWGLCGGLDVPGRLQADAICRELDSRFPATGTIFDCAVDVGKVDWANWEDRVPGVWRPSVQGAFHKYVVVTADVARMAFLLKWTLHFHQHVLLQGHTGCGKSVIVQHALSQLDAARFAQLDAYLTQDTTTATLQQLVQSKLEKRQRNTYGALGSRPALLLVVDDLTAPSVTEFGSQPTLELLRQLLEYKFMADLQHPASGVHKHIVGLQMLATLSPPGGARATPSSRLVSKAVMLNMNTPEEAHLRRMFRTLLTAHLMAFEEPVRALAPALIASTVDLHRSVSTALLPTPATPHYVFTVRDMAAVVRGLMRTDPKHVDTKEALVRVWAHECMRIFGDRLVNDSHRATFQRLLTNITSDPRGLDLPSNKIFATSGVLAFSDLLSDDATALGSGLDQDSSRGLGEPDRMPYTDVTHRMLQVKELFVQRLADFNTDPTKHTQQLVFFEAAQRQVLHAYRTLSQPRANLMLVGVGGSGRHSVARMGAYLAGLQVRTIHPGPKYDLRSFRDELKDLYRECALKRSPTALLVADDQLTMDSFYQDLSALCLHGHIASLFTTDELAGLLDDLRSDAQRNNVPLTPDSLLAYLIARFRAHFHLVLCMSPSDKAFAMRCASFASLFSTCTMQAFAQWPLPALKQVAQVYLGPYLAPHVTATHAHAATASTATAVLRLHNPDHMSAPPNAMPPNATGTMGTDGFTVFPSVPLVTDLMAREGSTSRALQGLASIMADMHESARELASDMYAQSGRVNHITPTKYLDLLATYKHVLARKHAEITKNIRRLHVSIRKLEATQASVSVLGAELEEKTRAAAVKKVQCDKLLVEIMQKQRQADQQRVEVEAEAEKCREEAQETMRMKMFAQSELDKVTPSLEKAIRALEKLTKQAVTEVKSYTKPPKTVEKVMCAVMTILEKEATWANAKKQLSDPNFLHKLKTFEKDKISNATLKAINKYTRHKDFNADDISNVSVAAGALCDWVCAMEMYAKVYRDVQPRRDALALAELKLDTKTSQLLHAQQQLEEVAANVGILEARYRDSVQESQVVAQQTQSLQTKLQRARAVVEGLADKRGKWDQQLQQCALQLHTLIADCVVVAGHLVYMGPFTDRYRDDLCARWLRLMAEHGFQCAPDFSVTAILTTSADLNAWSVHGLPSDAYSVSSAVLVQHATRTPFIIDPQLQASTWLRANELQHGLVHADMSAGPQWVSSLTQAMVKGLPILLENAPAQLPALLEPVLSLTAFATPSVHASAPNVLATLHFNDMDVDVRCGFRLYLISAEANPDYRPELAIRCTVVNFAVTQSALEQQMLSLLVSLEEPQLEAERTKLLRDVANDSRLVVELEDNILTLLGNAQGSLLEDESLVVALSVSKKTEAEVVVKLTQAQVAAEHLDSSRQAYQPCAVRAALGYFVLVDMAKLSPMYQFSLLAYAEVFSRAVVQSRGKQQVEIGTRVSQVIEAHTAALYAYAASALKEQHKLVFAFHLCLAKLHADGLLDPAEVHCLLRGPTLVAPVAGGAGVGANTDLHAVADGHSGAPSSPPTSQSPFPWLGHATWLSLLSLERLPSFTHLTHTIERHAAEWRQWIKASNPPPEKLAPPGQWQGKKSELHHLLLLRVLRPDRLVPAIRAFVAASLDKSFIEPPKIDLAELHARSSPAVPMLFFLQPGTAANSLQQIHTLAQSQQTHVHTVSLGRGQQHAAAAAIVSGATHGHWVHIANLHLLPLWLGSLQRLAHAIANKFLALHTPAPAILTDALADGAAVASLSAPPGTAPPSTAVLHALTLGTHTYKIPKVNPKFRLFLSTQPTLALPHSLLQSCTKISLEPPLGMRAGLYRIYSSITDADLNVGAKPAKYRRLLYSLAWFHCLCMERARFRALGWATAYEFAQNDFTVAHHLLSQEFVRAGEDVSWHGLRYMIGQCVYGGRVSDAHDRRLLSVLVSQAINESVYDVKHDVKHTHGPAHSSGASQQGGLTTFSTGNVIPVHSTAHSHAHAANAFAVMPDESACTTAKDYLREVRRLAAYEDECVCLFGQHANALVAAQRDTGLAVLAGLAELNSLYMHVHTQAVGPAVDVTMPPTPDAPSATSSPLEQALQHITACLPERIEVPPAAAGEAGLDDEAPAPLSVCMTQEIHTYNALRSRVLRDVELVVLSLRGHTSMTDRLLHIHDCLRRGQCPLEWRGAPHYPPTLAAWLLHLREAAQQLAAYVLDTSARAPVTAGLLFFPKCYFACVERMVLRNAPLTRGPIVLWYLTPVSVAGPHGQPAAHGCVVCEGVCACSPVGRVRGVLVENGRWDMHHQCLSDPTPLELVSELPLMQFTPVFRHSAQLPRYMVQVPLYTHSARTSDAHVMDVCVMAHNRDSGYWVKRATAFLLAAHPL